MHRGVYAVGHAGLSREGRWMAAVLGAGEDSALSHLSVARFWDVSRWRTPRISVISTKRRKLDGVEVHTVRSLDPRDVLVRNGIRVTTVARMCVDLTDELDPYQLAYVIYRAEYWHIFNLQGHRGRDGARERAPQPARPRTRARAQCERLGRHAQRQGGRVPPPQTDEPLVNVKVDGIEVDFHWPDDKRIVEVDGVHHNRSGHEARRRAPRRATHRARVA